MFRLLQRARLPSIRPASLIFSRHFSRPRRPAQPDSKTPGEKPGDAEDVTEYDGRWSPLLLMILVPTVLFPLIFRSGSEADKIKAMGDPPPVNASPVTVPYSNQLPGAMQQKGRKALGSEMDEYKQLRDRLYTESAPGPSTTGAASPTFPSAPASFSSAPAKPSRPRPNAPSG